MPPIEAIRDVSANREAMPAIDLFLSIVTGTPRIPFQQVLSTNLTATDDSEASTEVTGVAPPGNLQISGRLSADTPPELLAVLLGMLGSGVINLPLHDVPMDGAVGTPAVPSGATATAGVNTPVLPSALGVADRAVNPGSLLPVVTAVGGAQPAGTADLSTEAERSAVALSPELVVTQAESRMLAAGQRSSSVRSGPNVAQGTASIPAQAPIVVQLLPPVSMPAELVIEVPEPVGAVEIQVGLPSAQVGDRPGVTGDRLAVAAEMGARLASANVASPAFTQQVQQLAAASEVRSASFIPLQQGAVGPADAVIGGEMGVVASLHTSAAAGATLPGEANNNSVTLPGVPPSTSALPSGDTLRHASEAIQAQLRRLDADGRAEFHLQLHPPELGPLRVHLSTHGGEIHGQLYVADEGVRRWLQEQLPELRQRLETLGLPVGQWEITMDTGSRHHHHASGGSPSFADDSGDVVSGWRYAVAEPPRETGEASMAGRQGGPTDHVDMMA